MANPGDLASFVHRTILALRLEPERDQVSESIRFPAFALSPLFFCMPNLRRTVSSCAFAVLAALLLGSFASLPLMAQQQLPREAFRPVSGKETPATRVRQFVRGS
jgi:hypothetical protein